MAFNLFEPPKVQLQQAQQQTQQQQQQQPVVQQQQKIPKVDPASPTSGMDAVIANMYTSPEQEEKMRKASVANQRIMAIGDALRHIGNIYNTVNYAPSQQFNKPWEEEQTRYEKGKAVRDAANARFYSYQQAKAEQDAKARQWAAEQEAKERQFRYNAAKDAALLAEKQRQFNSTLGYRKANDEANRKLRGDHYNELERQGRQRIGIASQNAKNAESHRKWIRENKGKGGSGVAPLDTPKGRITPNGRSYSNQLLQMFDYAKSKGYVQESDVAKRLRELGFGKDQSDNVKRQMVMDLLRTNQDMGDYASSRLGWNYGSGAGGGMDLGLEDDDEDEMDLGLD